MWFGGLWGEDDAEHAGPPSRTLPFSYPGLHECLLQNCGQARQYEGIYMCDDDCVAPSEWGAGHAMWFATRNGFGTLIEA